MSAFESGFYEDATWPVGDPVVIPTEFFPSDFTCRPNMGTTRMPDTDDFVELGRPQIEAVDNRLMDTPEQVSNDVLLLETWKKFGKLSEDLELTEGLDETVLSRLFVIAEHVGPIVKTTMRENKKRDHRDSWQREMFDTTLLNTDWLQEVLVNPMVSSSMSATIVDFVGEMKPAKKIEINIVRLASTIWYTKMNAGEFKLAEQDAPTIFTKLLVDEITVVVAIIENSKRPDRALDVKHKAIQQLSPYAFAGIPMRPDQVDVIATLCRE